MILLLASRRKERQTDKGSERRREGEGDRGRKQLSSGDWVSNKGKNKQKGGNLRSCNDKRKANKQNGGQTIFPYQTKESL